MWRFGKSAGDQQWQGHTVSRESKYFWGKIEMYGQLEIRGTEEEYVSCGSYFRWWNKARNVYLRWKPWSWKKKNLISTLKLHVITSFLEALVDCNKHITGIYSPSTLNAREFCLGHILQNPAELQQKYVRSLCLVSKLIHVHFRIMEPWVWASSYHYVLIF